MSAQDPPPSAWRQQQPDWQQRPDPGTQPEQPPAGTYPPPPPAYSYQGAVAGAPGPAAVGELAEWWRRALGIILDWLVLIIPTAIIVGILGVDVWSFDTDPVTGTREFNVGSNLVSNLLSLLIWVVYAAVLEGSARGQSVGKMALGIRICDAETGGPIGPARAALRRLVYSVLFFLLFIQGLINVLSPLWDSRKQAWHDKAVNSLVVRTS